MTVLLADNRPLSSEESMVYVTLNSIMKPLKGYKSQFLIKRRLLGS